MSGRIVTEMSIMTIAEDFHFLITAAVAQWHDMEWLKKHMPQDAAFAHRGRDGGIFLPDPDRSEIARDPRRKSAMPI